MLVTRPRDMRRGPGPGDGTEDAARRPRPYGPSPPAAQILVLKFTGGRLP